MKKYDFKISYSLLSTFESCERDFYYIYIAKEKPTNFVTDIYHLGGNLVHSFIEKYYKLYKNKQISLENIKEQFELEWNILNLDNKVGFFNEKLDKNKYFESVVNALNTDCNITSQEELIEIEDVYTLKSYIDAIANNGETLIDWKTNSNVNEAQLEQLKFYAYMYYRKHKKLPKEGILEYIKINKKLKINYTKDDLIYIKNKIINFIKNLHSKEKFEDFKHNSNACKFCEYKDLCYKHNISKINNTITITIKNNTIYFDSNLSTDIERLISDKFSYEIDNKYYVLKACKAKGIEWDGIVRFYKNKKLPLGFLNDLIDLLNKNNYNINIIDLRKKINDFKEIKTKKQIELRDYQRDAIDVMLDKKIGIIALPTGAGKTIVATEFIRRTGLNTLFVIDNKTLLSQTKQEFETFLDAKISSIMEGNLNLEFNDDRTYSVATIQTIVSKLKQKDKNLINYLKTVETLIIDEAHIAKSKSYSMLYKYLTNCKYFFGLTGTPGDDKKTFLELQKMLGNVIYKVDHKTLIENKYLIKPNIKFVKYDFGNYLVGNYNEIYEQLLENNSRNFNVINILKNNKNKLTLIIVNRIKQGNEIEKLLKANNYDYFFIRGEIDNKTRDKILQEAREGHSRVLIGTAQIVSKGLNIKNLEIIINLTGNVTDIQTLQSLGRIMRIDKNKTNAIFYDFFDNVEYFKEHSIERIKTFLKHDYNVELCSFDENGKENLINKQVIDKFINI